MFVEPNVTLLAHARLFDGALTPDPDADKLMPPGLGVLARPFLGEMKLDEMTAHADSLVEFAGRACYQSFHKPNPATRANADYLRRTLFEQGHWSIAEHASATLYFTGVSRAFLPEISRHRHLSFSVQSQRFVDESDANFVLPPAIEPGSVQADVFHIQCEDAVKDYAEHVATLQATGMPRKQAREASRGILPNAVETRMVITGNLRAWHEVIQRRTAPDADAEMQRVMNMARKQLAKVSPVIFGGDNAA